MTLKALEKRLRYWQRLLNLSEWKITLKWMSQEDAASCVGLAWWIPEELTSEIHISKKTEHKEATVLHELLHVLFEGTKPPPREYSVAKERALNNMTAALMGLEYK